MRRSRKFTLDALEGRDLLSLTPILGLIAPPVVAAASAGAASGQVSSSDSSQESAGASLTNPGGSGITTDLAPPRPNEVRNRAFRGTFAGRVVEQAPRLQDQDRQFFFNLPGNTNQFLHGTLQMRLYTPNATAVSPFDQVTGTFSIADRSTQSGGLILADLTGDPAKVDAKGRPTEVNFFVNGGGGSNGIYASSVGYGKINITYRGNLAKVQVRGSIFIQGIGDPLATFQTNLQRSL